MSAIKVYQNVRPQQEGISFDIKRMEDIYDIRQGIGDEPHRHEYYTILFILQAKGKHIIDFHEFELSEHQIYFVSPGQVHQIIEEEKSVGCVMTFSPQFMLENGIEAAFISNLHLFQDFGYTPPLEIQVEEVAKFISVTNQIYDFVHSNQNFKYQAVGALLKLFLIYCNNSCTLSQEENTQTVHASVTLLRNFKELLDQQFKIWHKVSDYANALYITPDYFNSSVKSLTGKSAKEHIQSRIIIAAKRLLRFSNLQNKEIAYELGFSEPANFSQFFKKCTKISPSVFRQKG